MEQVDYILINCELEELKAFIASIENNYTYKILKKPALSLTMVRAEDSVEGQEFYLGEALTTECEIGIDSFTGYGICMGDEPVRSYCIAFFDVLMQMGNDKIKLDEFLNYHGSKIKMEEKIEYNQLQRTRVDFKMMEQA